MSKDFVAPSESDMNASHRLPKLRAEAEESLQSVQTSLSKLPPPPSDNPVLELLRMVSAIATDIQSLVRGVEGYEGLLQQCRPFHQTLKYDILSTQPNFRPFKSAKDDQIEFETVIDKDDTLESGTRKTVTSNPIYLEDVRSKVQR